jgi:soluble lytic murein transglycosylase-like protein
VIQVESNFDPDAVSRAGARGLMQLMPGTAAMYSLGANQSFNPYKNIEAGIKHLAYLKGLFPNNAEFVIAAYNAGENNVVKYNGIPPFPETVDYVKKVKSSHNIFKRVFF